MCDGHRSTPVATFTNMDFNPNMDKQLHAQWKVGWITYPFLNFNGSTVVSSHIL